MVRQKTCIFYQSTRAAAAAITLLSCTLAFISLDRLGTKLVPPQSGLAAKFSALSQVALAATPRPFIAAAWNHCQQLLRTRPIGGLCQCSHRCPRLCLPGGYHGLATAAKAITPPSPDIQKMAFPAKTLSPSHGFSRTIAFVRCSSLSAPPTNL